MDRGGYFYAYLVNESSMNVYFDDFQVTHVTGKVLEENHYYPFGMLNAQLSVQPTDKPLNYYKYNGKELQKELNLEWLDYGARFYDAQVGRWHSVDPMAEKYSWGSPYIYGLNNPIVNIDPDGREPITLTALAIKMGIGFAIAAATDFSIQMTANMARGSSFGEALRNVDYTSVGASGVTGAVTVPGVSTLVRTAATVVSVTSDAAMDYSINDGLETVSNGGKSFDQAVLDATVGVISDKAVNSAIDGAKTAIANDIKSGTYSTLNKQEKATLQQASNVVNSEGFNAGVEFSIGIAVEAGNESSRGSSTSNGSTQKNRSLFTPVPQISPADATNYVNPYSLHIK